MQNQMSDFQNYIALSRYARYIDDKQRRETWEETVDRYIDFLCDRVDKDANISE